MSLAFGTKPLLNGAPLTGEVGGRDNEASTRIDHFVGWTMKLCAINCAKKMRNCHWKSAVCGGMGWKSKWVQRKLYIHEWEDGDIGKSWDWEKGNFKMLPRVRRKWQTENELLSFAGGEVWPHTQTHTAKNDQMRNRIGATHIDSNRWTLENHRL